MFWTITDIGSLSTAQQVYDSRFGNPLSGSRDAGFDLIIVHVADEEDMMVVMLMGGAGDWHSCKGACMSERPSSRLLIFMLVVVSVAAMGLSLWDLVRQGAALLRG